MNKHRQIGLNSFFFYQTSNEFQDIPKGNVSRINTRCFWHARYISEVLSEHYYPSKKRDQRYSGIIHITFKVCYSLYFTLYICFSFISFESLPFRNINSYGFTVLIHLKAFHYKFRTFYINFHKSYTSFQIENKKILFAKYYKYVKQMIDKINYNTILRTILSNSIS